ncbi:hypothetical protein ATCVOR07043_538L [Acanthocystis turfacea Chlorella virus OR0704.3]|nr:hypothetical protein ATCVCan0610SP_540L [Acanthocystis turfacea Chlorella virus Can0610SP]AGE57002.1 hypothetical protein ATCVNEJV3_538L [Acanthocystis turfacea Chlorella virus NE-JV-3]AGE59453.1 hypothetical protein ATCVOR07043_538L [Acanthocystis turfacea Chlorella virus OR0704.3]
MFDHIIMSFNDVMRQFLTDLAEVFPEDPAIVTALESLDDLIRMNYKKPAAMFLEAIGPYAQKIGAHDESVFADMDFPGVDFKTLWNSGISQNTKNAIFMYLKQLLLLSVSK